MKVTNEKKKKHLFLKTFDVLFFSEYSVTLIPASVFDPGGTHRKKGQRPEIIVVIGHKNRMLGDLNMINGKMLGNV